MSSKNESIKIRVTNEEKKRLKQLSKKRKEAASSYVLQKSLNEEIKEEPQMKEYGKLINNAGKGNYLHANDIDNVIKYITRTSKKPSDDLIACGGLGVTEPSGIDGIIEEFHDVQKMHTRKGNFGRYIDHEYFSFSTEAENFINENNLDVDKIARKMAYDFYDNEKCQVVYGVHRPSESNKHMHVHFAINTVNYTNGNKRRENKRQTAERNNRFQKIVYDEFKTSKESKTINIYH